MHSERKKCNSLLPLVNRVRFAICRECPRSRPDKLFHSFYSRVTLLSYVVYICSKYTQAWNFLSGLSEFNRSRTAATLVFTFTFHFRIAIRDSKLRAWFEFEFWRDRGIGWTEPSLPSLKAAFKKKAILNKERNKQSRKRISKRFLFFPPLLVFLAYSSSIMTNCKFYFCNRSCNFNLSIIILIIIVALLFLASSKCKNVREIWKNSGFFWSPFK